MNPAMELEQLLRQVDQEQEGGPASPGRPRPSSPSESSLIRGAIQRGNRNENSLTDLVFFRRYPARRGQALTSGHRRFLLEWLNIRNKLVRPALRQSAPASLPAVFPAPVRTANLTDDQVRDAASRNQALSRSLGWDVLYDAIASWILGFNNMTPTATAFARAVARWQWNRGLAGSGVLDYATWLKMLAEAKDGIPRAPRTREGVVRPHGLNAIVATFGDPTQRGWESANLARVTAPSGRVFLTGVSRLRVHRLIRPEFERLFADIHSQGMWQEMVPSDGTFVCRTKAGYGKKPCGTPGITFNQLSTHSWGITIDIRSNDYPLYTARMQAARRRLTYPPPTLTGIFQAHGFHWGLWFMDGKKDRSGRINFAGADPMHFQFATGY